MIRLLYPTARVNTAIDVFLKWNSAASSLKNIEWSFAVDTLKDKETLLSGLKEFASNTLALLKHRVRVYVTYPTKCGVCYPLYCLTRSLMYRELKNDDILIVVSDDFFPCGEWNKVVKVFFQDTIEEKTIKPLLLVQNDGYQALKSNHVVTIPILNYAALKRMNHIIYHPSYNHLWSDVECYYVAKELGILLDIREEYTRPIFTHKHWVNMNRHKDELDINLNAKWLEDENMYKMRAGYSLERKFYTPYLNRVCFSLWGNKDMYWQGAIVNAIAYEKELPDFKCTFFVDKNCLSMTTPNGRKCKDILDSLLLKSNVEVHLIETKTDELGNQTNAGMFWRFRGLEQNTICYLSRDTDSRLTGREIAAVKEWLASDSCFHIMRDHPFHVNGDEAFILGGLFGVRFGYLKDIRKRISDFMLTEDAQLKGCDQRFLSYKVWPEIRQESFVHDEITSSRFLSEYHSFPTAREDFEYVGDVYDENDKRSEEFKIALEKHLRENSLF